MSYGARIEELKKLENERPSDPGTSSQDEINEERKQIQAAIDRFATVRTVHFDQLARILESGGAEKAWEDAVSDSRSSAKATLGDALHDVKRPTIAGLNLVGIATELEDKFHDGLARGTAVGAALDAIGRYKKELGEKTEALKAKWEESRKRADEIMRDEESVLAEIQKILKNAIDIESPRHKNRLELGRAWIKDGADAAKLVGSVLPLPGYVGEFLENAKGAAENWEKMAGDLEARKARYEAYFVQDHASLLVMFKGTRDDAKDFLDKHDYTQLVLGWTGKARSALSEITGGAKTSGQKSDAEELVGKLSATLETAEKEARAQFDDFVSENKTRFFGAFTPDLDKAVLGSEKWDELYKNIAAIDIAGVLSKWIEEDGRDIREIDQSDMPESWKNEFRVSLMESLKKLAATEEEMRRNNGPDVLTAWIKGKAKALADKLR